MADGVKTHIAIATVLLKPLRHLIHRRVGKT